MVRHQRGNGGNRSRRINPNMQQQKIASTAGQFANALIRGDQDTLARMTFYSQETGGIGSDASNVSALQKSGITGVIQVLAHGKNKQAVAFFGNGSETPYIGLFQVVDDGHVMGNWELYKKI